MVRDLTGRLRERPYYDAIELDERSQQLVIGFLTERYGEARFPISTNDMTVLIEQHAERLDLYANLTALGEEIEGATTIYRGRKPEVAIARELTEAPGRDHRLRMTMAHELGHVILHAPLWGAPELTLQLWAAPAPVPAIECHRHGLRGLSADWLEWQAFYVGSGMLMPKAELVTLLKGLGAPVAPSDPAASERAELVSAAFAVSPDAARIRLLQLGFLLQQDALALPV